MASNAACNRTYAWNAENLPTSITSGGTTETYGYDADGARITKTRAGATTLYLEGLWEETLGQRVKTYYTFNGKAVALRDSTDTTNYPASIHGDHLGSVSVVTNSTGGTVSQEFDPWGNVRSGGTSTTKRNFTGQYLDDTGLLFYNARYYDPAIGRFLSADTVVPGSGVLTAAPSDATASAVWTVKGGGPGNPQDLNRYSYGGNNPIKHTDPTGHCFGILVGIDTLVCAAAGAAIVGVGSYLALEAARRLAEQYPPDPCALVPCDANGDAGQSTVPDDASVGGAEGLPSADGQLASPPNPTPPSNDPQSEYEQTTKGKSVENRRTNVTRQEFERALRDSGWNETKSADGKVTIFEKNGARYVVRDNAKSTGGPTADYYRPGSSSVDLKIRLGGP